MKQDEQNILLFFAIFEVQTHHPVPMKRVRVILSTLVLIILPGGFLFLNPLLPIITGYAAKNLSSGLFLANRTQESMQVTDLHFSFIRFVENSVDTTSKTGSDYPDVPRDMYYCSGHYGQYIYIIPSKELVIVRTGFTKNGEFDQNGFIKGIVAAIK